MEVTYKKLWKLLIDKEMNKTDIRKATDASSATIAMLTRGDDEKTSIMTQIGEVLDCDIGDIEERC